MTLYAFCLCLHVIAAILGLGSIVGTLVVAGSEPPVPELLRRFGRRTNLALVAMLLTGAGVEAASGGAFHEALWFRISFALLLVLGALQALAARLLRSGRYRGVGRTAGAMCALVAIVTVLMEAKPW